MEFILTNYWSARKGRLSGATDQTRRTYSFLGDLGYRIFGVAATALGLVGLTWADFALVWQPVPADFPARTTWANIFNASLVVAGLALQWPKTRRAAAVMLILLYGICAVAMHLPRVAAHPLSPAPWFGLAEQTCVFGGSLLIAFRFAVREAQAARRVARTGQTLIGLCLIAFGVAHFVYVAATADLVPRHLPPSQTFWARGTGLAHIAAGISVVSGIMVITATRLLTIMFLGFGILVHLPTLWSDITSHMAWTANAVNLTLIATAWLLADFFNAHNVTPVFSSS